MHGFSGQLHIKIVVQSMKVVLKVVST